MVKGTLGQILINDALPEEMRDYRRVVDKKTMTNLLREVAQKHPEKYRDISFKLLQVGRDAAQESGGLSFSLQHMRVARAAQATRMRIRKRLNDILSRSDLTDDQRRDLIVRAVGSESKPQQDAIYEEALKSGNPLAIQVLSGSRGNKMNLSSLLGSDLLYADHHDRPVPIPVLHSYSEGLTPAEYWAGAYGARKGVTSAKFATQDAGFLSKQLNQAAHRLVVEDQDYEDEEQQKIIRGVPVDTDDMDNEGALLARDVGPYKKNTHLTPKVLKHLKRLGHDRILVRSPMVGGTPAGGVYGRDVGVRERGEIPGRGEMVGLQAAQALSEPLSQAQLSAKHSGGVAGEEKAVSGFDYINQLIQIPKTFKGGAAHSTVDGTVQRIEPAPAGGHYLTINDKQHYVGKDFDLKVKKGDKVEAGDVLSEGIPNPSKIVQYKGIGEGRRYFVNTMKDAMKEAGLGAHRRNVELLSRGLINHVKLNDEFGDFVPDDVVPYSTLEHTWQPREGFKELEPRHAIGKYLERPVLHYTIGTRVQPSMLKDLENFGVDRLTVHDEPAPFEPHMVRGMSSLQHDPDWMTKMYGSGLKRSITKATQRGATSDARGTSFVPSLSQSLDFGHVPGGAIRQPEPGIKPGEQPEEEPKTFDAQPSGTQRTWFGGKLGLKPAGSSSNMVSKVANALGKGSGSDSKPQGLSGGGLSGGAGPKLPELPKMSGPNYTSGFKPGQGLMNSPMKSMVPSFVNSMNQALPGIGGALGIGMSLDSGAMSTLLEGKNGPGKRYGAAGYGPMGGFNAHPVGVHTPTGTGQTPGGITNWISNNPGKTGLGLAAVGGGAYAANKMLRKPVATAARSTAAMGNNLAASVADDAAKAAPGVAKATGGLARHVPQPVKSVGKAVAKPFKALGAALGPAGTVADVHGALQSEFTGEASNNAEWLLDQYNQLTPTQQVAAQLGGGGAALLAPVEASQAAAHLINNTGQQISSHGNQIGDAELNALNGDGSVDSAVNSVVNSLQADGEPQIWNSWEHLQDTLAEANPQARQQLDELVNQAYSNYGSTETPNVPDNPDPVARAGSHIGGFVGTHMTDNAVSRGIQDALVQRLNTRMSPAVQARAQQEQAARQQELQSNLQGMTPEQRAIWEQQANRFNALNAPPVYSMNPQDQAEIQQRDQLARGIIPNQGFMLNQFQRPTQFNARPNLGGIDQNLLKELFP